MKMVLRRRDDWYFLSGLVGSWGMLWRLVYPLDKLMEQLYNNS